MRVMVFVKATEDSERGVLPSAEMLEAMAAMDRMPRSHIRGDWDR